MKYKLALLEIADAADVVPNREKLLRDKILKGMPKDCRHRLEMYWNDKIHLKGFFDRVEVERVIVLILTLPDCFSKHVNDIIYK